MQTTIPTLGTISWGRRLMPAAALGFLLVFGFAHPALAQNGTNPLQFFKNYILSGGDYAVGGVGLAGLGVNGTAMGKITIPDPNQPNATSVTAGADVVAAFVYWQEVEDSKTAFIGQHGSFNNFPITGTVLGANNAPVSWSSGGCVGSSQGSKTIRTYRADVRRFLPLDANGHVQTPNAATPGTYPVSLPDSGATGNTPPIALGMTLVIVSRIVPQPAPLSAVVIYEGSYSGNNGALITSQEIKGFYQPSFTATSTMSKLTHIAGSGQSNKFEDVSINGVSLPSLYGALPSFPGIYNGSWDNPTWFPNRYGNGKVVQGTPFTVSAATTVVTPSTILPAGCVSWGAMIFSTTVQDTDKDGLIDVWETNSGLMDPNGNPLPDIHAMGADPNVPDIFTEIDYMNLCATTNLDGTCATVAHSHKPSQAVLDKVGDAFANKGINAHFDIGSNYVGNCSTTHPLACPDPYIIQTGGTGSLQGGDVITETMAYQTASFPNYPGTVNWKTGFWFIKNGGPGDPAAIPPIPATPGHFDPLRKHMFHYAVFGHALGLPQWRMRDGTLVSVNVSNHVATVTTLTANGIGAGDFVSISGVPLSLGLTGTYSGAAVMPGSALIPPNPNSFTVSVPNASDGTYNNSNELGMGVGNGVPRTNSGVADLGGGDLLITLGLWQNFGSEFIRASTLMHEVGHNLILGHAGDISDPYNCKPNYQSVMSYLFQVQGLLDKEGVPHVDYSGEALNTLSENNLSESTGLGSPLPYLPRWYAPLVPGTISFKVGTSPASKHCDGTPITGGVPMVRVDGTTISGSVDWDDDGTFDESGIMQDANYDGKFTDSNSSPPGFSGFNDWSHLNLRQIGARRNVFGFSLDVGLSDDSGDLGAADTSLGAADTSLGAVDTSLGAADESLGAADTSLGAADTSLGAADTSLGGGELDEKTAAAIGDAPSSLTATPGKFNIDLDWSSPTVGIVTQYQVWRGTCPTTGACSITNSFPAIIGTTVPSGQNCDGGFLFCDTNTKKGVLYLYFVTANVTFQNVTNRSGKSNSVTAER